MSEERKKKTSGLAIASLVCGCLFIIPFVGIAALILGIIALVLISDNKETLKGKGMAVAGIVLGALGVLGIILAILIPPFTGRSGQGRVAAARADIEANLATALKLYELDNGTFPAGDEGLGALVNKPASASGWNGPYLERKPLDPWGREYIYDYPAKHDDEYDLYSLGPDGVESDDDITNWE